MASSFADTTMFAPQACLRVVAEFALALGLASEAQAGSAGAAPGQDGHRWHDLG